MRKFIFSFVSCLVLFTCQLAAAQIDTTPVSFGDWTYVANKRGITLTAYVGEAENLWIPPELDGKPVTRLGKNIFRGNSRLRSVIISGSVTDIESSAFEECINLEEVRLGYDMRTISSSVFRNCHKLKSIYIPKDVRSIGDFAFQNCYAMTEAYFTSVRSVGESAFENCTSLVIVGYGNRLDTVGAYAFRNTAWMDHYNDDFVFIGKGVLLAYKGHEKDVTIPWATVKISGAFSGNEDIETVFVPETVLEIGKYAFQNALNLKSINIPQYVTKISSSAFEGCRNLENVQLPRLLRTIDGSAFRGCESITEVVIPPRVKSLSSQVFGSCPSLRSVTIPATVTKIDKNAFQGSGSVLLHVTLNSAADAFAQQYGIPYRYPDKENDGLHYYPAEDGIHISRYTGNHMIVQIPRKIDGKVVTAVDDAAFQMAHCVRRVLLPASLKSIGDWAFSYMDNLEYIVIPAGIKSMGMNVFTGSDSLREIQLPERLREIGESPFNPDAETLICAHEDSYASVVLAEMGYEVQPYERCEIPKDAFYSADSCPADGNVIPAAGTETREVLAIPAGLRVLNADLIRSAGPDLVLFIPDSVEEIDEGILADHHLTIVGSVGSAAEYFAGKFGVKFLVRN